MHNSDVAFSGSYSVEVTILHTLYMWLHIFPRNKTLFEKRGAKHVLSVIVRATCARGLYVWHKCERQLQSALTFLTYKAKLSQACDLSTESTTTFNKFPLAASQVLRRDKSGNGTRTLLEMTNSLGVQSESVELDICRNKERGQEGLFLRGDGFCNPVAIARNI